jgi:hypothetical protein
MYPSQVPLCRSKECELARREVVGAVVLEAVKPNDGFLDSRARVVRAGDTSLRCFRSALGASVKAMRVTLHSDVLSCEGGMKDDPKKPPPSG